MTRTQIFSFLESSPEIETLNNQQKLSICSQTLNEFLHIYSLIGHRIDWDLEQLRVDDYDRETMNFPNSFLMQLYSKGLRSCDKTVPLIPHPAFFPTHPVMRPVWLALALVCKGSKERAPQTSSPTTAATRSSAPKKLSRGQVLQRKKKLEESAVFLKSMGKAYEMACEDFTKEADTFRQYEFSHESHLRDFLTEILLCYFQIQRKSCFLEVLKVMFGSTDKDMHSRFFKSLQERRSGQAALIDDIKKKTRGGRKHKTTSAADAGESMTEEETGTEGGQDESNDSSETGSQ